MKTPVSIALEGLDGVGKTCVSNALSSQINAHYLRTPPELIRSFREYFDGSDDPTRRAYYMVGNFLAAKEIARIMEEGESVVIDRYYASTVAFKIGQENLEMSLPPLDDLCYKWPKELLKPTYMFLLRLPEKERVNRLNQRALHEGVSETVEESKIRIQLDTGNRINEVYKRLGAIEIPLSVTDSTDDVVIKILQYLSIVDDNVN